MKTYIVRYTTEMPLGKKAGRPEVHLLTVEDNTHGEAQEQVRRTVGLVWFIESRYVEE